MAMNWKKKLLLLVALAAGATSIISWLRTNSALSATKTGVSATAESIIQLSKGAAARQSVVAVSPMHSTNAKSAPSALQIAYNAVTIDDIYAQEIVAQGESAYDLSALKHRAEALCQDPLGTKRKRTFIEFIEMMNQGAPLSPTQLASAQLLDGFRARFCTRGIAAYAIEGRDLDIDAEAFGMSALANALRVQYEYGEKPDQSEVSEKETESVRAALLDFMAQTESPMAFRLSAELLGQDTPLGEWWAPPKSYTVNAPKPSQARAVGGEIAFCQLAGNACAANTLTTIRACMPANCRAGESLMAYYRRTQSPEVIEQAQAYANALLAMRRERGP